MSNVPAFTFLASTLNHPSMVSLRRLKSDRILWTLNIVRRETMNTQTSPIYIHLILDLKSPFVSRWLRVINGSN